MGLQESISLISVCLQKSVASVTDTSTETKLFSFALKSELCKQSPCVKKALPSIPSSISAAGKSPYTLHQQHTAIHRKRSLPAGLL